MSVEQLEQLRQKQKVKPKDAAETPKQRAIAPQIVLKSKSAKQLEQPRQKQKVKPKDAAETPKQRAIVP